MTERRVMTSGDQEERQKQEVLGEGSTGPLHQSVSASELRDLYRKVNGTLLQLRGMMERIGIHV